VEAGHRIPGDLGEAGFGGVFGFGIGSTESHSGFLNFKFLREVDFLCEFLGYGGANGASANGNTAAEKAGVLDEDQVCRAGAEV
jgi:hypothetical protein